MATFVLVHGGGHGGWCYQPVAKIMRSRGQDVYTPTPSLAAWLIASPIG